MKKPFLPYGRQTISQADLEAVREALLAPMLTTGPRVEAFEEAFGAQTGARHAVAVANGTAALHLAAMALELGPDDIVLAPAMSFVASANGPHHTGARIVFVDCDAHTGLITPQTFAAAAERAGERASAAVIVHLNGEHADMSAIGEQARKRGIRLIEDASHAIGTRFAGPNGTMAEVGSCIHSDLTCFSLHPVKTITMGEGGVVTTNDGEMARRMRVMRNHGIERDPGRFIQGELALDGEAGVNPWYYEMARPGRNYRTTDFACALGLSQLGQLPAFRQRRQTLKTRYDRLFDGFSSHVRPVATAQDCDPCRHLYPVLIDFEKLGRSRAEAMGALRDAGIGSQVHYIPNHWQPYYRAFDPDLSLGGAESYYRRTLSLPLYPLMQDTDTDRVVAALGEALF